MSIKAPVLRTLYAALWSLATPILRRHKRLKHDFESRLVPKNWPFSHLPSCQRIWIQAASGGEASLSAALIEELSKRIINKEVEPVHLLCSSCTRQGMDIIEKTLHLHGAKAQSKHENQPELKKSLPDQDQVLETPSLFIDKVFFPLDSPKIMQRALEQYQPDLIILLETELWPGLMHEAKKANIPYFIFNARMTDKSFNTYKKFHSFFRTHQAELILATSQENAERYSAIFGSKVGLMPNIKFDLALNKLNKLKKSLNKDKNNSSASIQKLLPSLDPDESLRKKSRPWENANSFTSEQTPCVPDKLEDKLEDKPVQQASELEPKKGLCLALASVREEEEKDLIQFIKKLSADDHLRPFNLIIAPRHMHRIDAWKKTLDAAGSHFKLRSDMKTNSLAKKSENKKVKDSAICSSEKNEDESYPVILWDTFGELDFLYKMADAVFVGGSLAPLGGQNFLEALSAAIKPFIGPSYYNFEWIGKELFDKGFVHISNDACTLYHDIKKELLRLEKVSELELMKEKDEAALTFSSFLEEHSGGCKIVVDVLQKYLRTSK